MGTLFGNWSSPRTFSLPSTFDDFCPWILRCGWTRSSVHHCGIEHIYYSVPSPIKWFAEESTTIDSSSAWPIYLSPHHFAETMVTKDSFRALKKFSWLWDTYLRIVEHGLIEPFLAKVVNPTDVFHHVSKKHRTAISMVFYIKRVVGAFKRLYDIMEDFVAPVIPKVLSNMNLRLEQTEDGKIAGRTQIDFFRADLKGSDRNVALYVGQKAEWMFIFDLAIQ